jgi:hypothetical protein
MEAPLSICTKEEIRGVIRFLFAEGNKPVEIIRRMQAQYRDNCLSRSEELLEVVGGGQEGRQRQGLGTILKPLKEWCGKTDESQWMTMRRLPYV